MRLEKKKLVRKDCWNRPKDSYTTTDQKQGNKVVNINWDGREENEEENEEKDKRHKEEGNKRKNQRRLYLMYSLDRSARYFT